MSGVRFPHRPPSLRRSEASAWQSPLKICRGENMYYVYSLECKDGYYVGCTHNLKERIARHTSGQVPATAARLPITLVFYFAIRNKHKAFASEKYLKTGSGRAFINKHLM